MPDLPFPDHVREPLARPNPAVVVNTLRSDGAPVSVATWYLLDGDRVLLNMDHSAVRLAPAPGTPTVADGARRGRVVHARLTGRAGSPSCTTTRLADIDRLSTHYRGQPYPNRDSPASARG